MGAVKAKKTDDSREVEVTSPATAPEGLLETEQVPPEQVPPEQVPPEQVPPEQVPAETPSDDGAAVSPSGIAEETPLRLVLAVGEGRSIITERGILQPGTEIVEGEIEDTVIQLFLENGTLVETRRP